MTDTRTLLDPTAELKPTKRERTVRPASLDGLTIGLLDISKPRGDIFLDQIEARFLEKGLTVKRFTKPTYTRIAPVDLKYEIAADCDVVIEALAD